MKIIYLFLFLMIVSTEVSADQLKPFTSDGCSAFPDGTQEQNRLWLDCCTIHDKAYWMGGSYSKREAADAALQSCVASVGEPHVAIIMLAGVRVGGSPYWPTTFRWGYGWPYFRGYKVLVEAELIQVRARLLEYTRQSSKGH